jgi:hypothetical protein
LGNTNEAAFTISLSLVVVGCPLATSRPLRAQPPRKTSAAAENKNDMLIRNSQVKIPYSRSSGPWRCIERLFHPTWYRNGSYVSALANNIHHGPALFAPLCLPDKPNRNTKEGLRVYRNAASFTGTCFSMIPTMSALAMWQQLSCSSDLRRCGLREQQSKCPMGSWACVGTETDGLFDGVIDSTLSRTG